MASYVFTDYRDDSPYDEQIIELYSTKDKAITRLKEAVFKHEGHTLEEIRTAPELEPYYKQEREDDVLHDDRVDIYLDGGNVIWSLRVFEKTVN